MTSDIISGLDERQNELLHCVDPSKTPTPDQTEAIKARGKILVSAAAGSGKTSTMIDRIILMLDEGVRLEDMLILAYNNAAADELKKKLSDAIFNVACSSDEETSRRFAAELDSMSFCHISTIHSYCQSLIRENFDKTGISPDFEVLDSPTYAGIMNKALGEVLNDYAERGVSGFDDLREIFSRARKEDNLKEKVLDIFALMDIQPDREEFLSRVRELFSDRTRFENELLAYYRIYFEELLPYVTDSIDVLRALKFDKYAEAMRYFKELTELFIKADSLEEAFKLALGFSMPDRGKLKNGVTGEERDKFYEAKGLMDEAKSFIGGIKETAEMPFLDEGFAQNGVFVDLLINLTLDFEKKLKEMMSERNALSFEDLMSEALKLLKSRPELCGRFDAVFVDEYQDVNPTQEQIIERLVGGDCFMVGDTKQSIYGFRLADPRIYANRKRLYEITGEGKVINFNANFRSQKKILEFVNGVFGALMTPTIVGIDYKNEESFNVDLSSLKVGAPVETHVFVYGTDKDKAPCEVYDISKAPVEESRTSRREGLFIADTVKELVGHAVVGDRLAKYSDVAVLFRARSKEAQEIVDTLVSEGIPVSSAVFRAEGGDAEREILNFLRVIDNPRQDLPLAGYLLGFFGGLDEQQLAAVSECEGDCLYERLIAASLKEDETAKKIKEVLDKLSEYRLKASFVSVGELIASIVNDFMYDAYLLSKNESGLAAVRAMASSSSATEAPLGRFLEEYVPMEGEDLSSGGDRVQISTFHGYKGLEREFVFVADTFHKFNSSASKAEMITSNRGIADDGSCFIGLKYYDMSEKVYFKSLSLEAVKQQIAINQIKDELRLLYVALTRAKSRLYITGTRRQNKDGGYYNFKTLTATCMMDFLLKAKRLGALGGIFVKTDVTEDIGEGAKPEGIRLFAGKKEITGPLSRRIDELESFEYPHKAAVKLAMKYSVSALEGDEQTTTLYDEAADVGTAYHRVMQFVDYFVTDADGVEKELDRMVDEDLITAQQRARVDAEDILKCLRSDIMEEARQSERQGKCHREFSFMMFKPARQLGSGEAFDSDDRILAQGIIDLFIDGESKVIVDFKNSRLADEEMLKRYKKQLELYKMAVESGFSTKVDRIALYSFKTGKTIYL